MGRGLCLASFGLLISSQACFDEIPLNGEGWRCGADRECGAGVACVEGICGGSCVPRAPCNADALVCSGLEAGGQAQGVDQFDGWERFVTGLAGAPLVDQSALRRLERFDCNTSAVAESRVETGTRAMLRRSAPALQEIFVRAYVYVPSIVQPNTNIALVTLDVNGELSDVGIEDERRGTFFVDSPRGDPSKDGIVPRGRWFCLEVMYRPGTSEDTALVQVYADGMPQVESRAPTHSAGANLERQAVMVGLGAGAAQQTSIAAYFDEVAVGRSRLGCR